jgi:hypothetical protein
MTMPTPKLEAFTLVACESRTPEPLEILGQECLVKLANADTNGAAAVFHLDAPPMSGPRSIGILERTSGFTCWMVR